jgi:hypothetical protein
MSSTTPATAAVERTLKVQQKKDTNDEPTVAAIPSTTTQSVEEEQRLARLAVNRQAARICRQRKRDRVQSLEAAVVNLHQVNMLLSEQNAALRRRIHVDETPSFPALQSGLFQPPVNARVLENASHRDEMLVKVVALLAGHESAVARGAEDAFPHGARPGTGAGYGHGSSAEGHEHVPGLVPAGGDQEHMEGQYGAMSAAQSRGRVPSPVHGAQPPLHSTTAADGFVATMVGLLAGQLGLPGGVAGGEEDQPGMVRMQGTMAAPGTNPLMPVIHEASNVMQHSMSMPHDVTTASLVAHCGAAGSAGGGIVRSLTWPHDATPASVVVPDTHITHSGPGAEYAESAYGINSVYSPRSAPARSAPAVPKKRGRHKETTAGLLDALVAAMSGCKEC